MSFLNILAIYYSFVISSRLDEYYTNYLIIVWPLLVFLAWNFRKKDSVWFWSIFSSVFGLLFGALCSLYYVVVGTAGGTILNGLYAGFTWWIAGIPWDIVHGVGNFVIMFVLYKPVQMVMKRAKRLLEK